MKEIVVSLTIGRLSVIGSTLLNAPLDATECSLPTSVVAGNVTAENIVSFIVIITTIVANVCSTRSNRQAHNVGTTNSQSTAHRALRTLCIASFLLGVSMYLVMIDITRHTLADCLQLLLSLEGLRYLCLLGSIYYLASPILCESIRPRTHTYGIALLAIAIILTISGWAATYAVLIALAEITLHLLNWESIQLIIATLVIVTLVTASIARTLHRFADMLLIVSVSETIEQRYGSARFIGLFAVFLCIVAASHGIAICLVNSPSLIDLESTYGENICGMRTAKYNVVLLATEATYHGSDGHATKQYTFHYNLNRKFDGYVCRNPADQTVIAIAVSDCPEPAQLAARLLEMKDPTELEYLQLRDEQRDMVAYMGDDGLIYVNKYATADGVECIACVYAYNADGVFLSKTEYSARAVGEGDIEYYEAYQRDGNGRLQLYYTEVDKGEGGQVTWHNADGSIASI